MNLHATYERAWATTPRLGRVRVILRLIDDAGQPVELLLDMAEHAYQDFCFDITRTKPPTMSYRRVADEPADEYEPTLRDA